MAGHSNNGNGNGGKGRKRITRDDLTKSIEAAKQAAEAAAGAAEATLVALEARGQGPGEEDFDEPGEAGPEVGRPQPHEGPLAFQEFMARLRGVLDKAGQAVEVTENSAWVKIESRRNGHKVYLSKGKTTVGRVESTLPPSAVTGATEPGRPNGRIASWIPPDVRSVTEAIRQLATSDVAIRAPVRGGTRRPPSGGGSQGGPGGAGGGRRRGLVN